MAWVVVVTIDTTQEDPCEKHRDKCHQAFSTDHVGVGGTTASGGDQVRLPSSEKPSGGSRNLYIA